MSNLWRNTVQVVLETGRSKEEDDKRELFRGDVLSSSSPIDVAKDSYPIEECASTKGAFSGVGNISKGRGRFTASDLQKMYLELS